MGETCLTAARVKYISRVRRMYTASREVAQGGTSKTGSLHTSVGDFRRFLRSSVVDLSQIDGDQTSDIDRHQSDELSPC